MKKYQLRRAIRQLSYFYTDTYDKNWCPANAKTRGKLLQYAADYIIEQTFPLYHDIAVVVPIPWYKWSLGYMYYNYQEPKFTRFEYLDGTIATAVEHEINTVAIQVNHFGDGKGNYIDVAWGRHQKCIFIFSWEHIK